VNLARRAVADDVFAAGRAYDAGQANRLDRLRNLEPPTAELLAVLVRATSARRVLEIGTSNGYSTLWLADAAEANGGRVQTLDLDPRRTEQARANLEQAELDGVVELRTAGAARALTDAFNRLLEADPHLQSALVPIGAGLILAVDSD
jgi:predicted O-methyltransferase YrrM